MLYSEKTRRLERERQTRSTDKKKKAMKCHLCCFYVFLFMYTRTCITFRLYSYVRHFFPPTILKKKKISEATFSHFSLHADLLYLKLFDKLIRFNLFSYNRVYSLQCPYLEVSKHWRRFYWVYTQSTNVHETSTHPLYANIHKTPKTDNVN